MMQEVNHVGVLSVVLSMSHMPSSPSYAGLPSIPSKCSLTNYQVMQHPDTGASVTLKPNHATDNATENFKSSCRLVPSNAAF